MYIVLLILSIVSCICAILPIYGIAFTVILGLITLIFSCINLHSDDKKVKDVAIISIIVTIFSFILCAGINIYTIHKADELEKGENVTFTNLSDEYKSYKKDDTVKNDNLSFKILNTSTEDNFVYIDYSLILYGEKRTFSAFDLYLLDEEKDEIYYLTYDSTDGYVYTTSLGDGESIDGKLKFTLSDGYNIDNLYLVYNDNSSKFKVKI